MGIYDRDYYQEDRRGWLEGGARTMVINLILINVAVYVGEIFFQNLQLDRLLGVQADVWREPWNAWKLLTYGFTHSPEDVFHILFNMYALWLFGQELETTLGRKEFLFFYLSTIILAGLGWVGVQSAFFGGQSLLVGASGGVMGVAVVYAMRHPHRTIYVWFIPVPVWLFVGFIVLKDFVSFQGSLANEPVGHVAYEAHLAGALAGFLYQKYQWHLGNLLALLPSRRRRGGAEFPRVLKMRVHREPETGRRDDLESQVDILLDKIQREGEASLSAKERATLEEASRRYRNRKG